MVTEVALTGAAGRIGTVLRRGGAFRDCQTRLFDQRVIDDASPEEVATVGTLHDETALDAAVAGASSIIHLAGIANDGNFAEITRSNIGGTYNVLEAARRNGVGRVVLASSNHAIGFTARSRVLGTDIQPRPDGVYGVSKVAVEALGRLYADMYGISVISVRIGSCLPKPRTWRHLSTWLSPGDAVRLFHASVHADYDGALTVYGISANSRAWWDLEPGRDIGYEPIDNAECYVEEVRKMDGPERHDDPSTLYAGGRVPRVVPSSRT